MTSFVRYYLRMVGHALNGPSLYMAWLGFLALWVVAGLIAFKGQWDSGLIVTNMSDQVSWGAYIANFTFLVGVAAAAVLLVVPAYAFKREDIQKVVIIGELLAVSAIVMCLAFVTVDLGHPERFLNMIPFIGNLNLPSSILAWDVIALNGYLLLNLHIPGYVLYSHYRGKKPDPRKYIPLVFLSMFWAVSIHTFTAFLYSGLGSRPFWNSAVLAPRFLISAFAAGPAILLVTFAVVRKASRFDVPVGAIDYLVRVVRVTLPINLFLLGAEVFTEFYTDSTHAAAAHYLFFGLEGHGLLRPYIWTSVTLSLLALMAFFRPDITERPWLLMSACGALVVGIWIEKGMGLIIPGFIPSPLGDLVEYAPSWTEFFVSAGIWAGGLLLFTMMVRAALAIETGELRAPDAKPASE
jgi:molybdopterin-containing oxidoreductase family membrane subunit